MVRLLCGRFDRSQPGNDLYMPLILFLLLALDIVHAGLDVPDLREQYPILLALRFIIVFAVPVKSITPFIFLIPSS